MDQLAKYFRDISTASDVDRVLKLVRKYIASVVPPEIAALPVQCQTLLRTNIGDVLAAAVIFARADVAFEGSAETATCLHEMSCALLIAAERIAQLS